MKQHITIEQLEELSQPARQKLRKYMLKDWSEPIQNSRTGEMFHAQIPTEDYLLTIGQMIEFLDEYYDHKDWDITNCGGKWDINDGLYRGELCDALWEAVKEVLEK